MLNLADVKIATMITPEIINNLINSEGLNVKASIREGRTYNRILYQFGNSTLDCPFHKGHNMILTVSSNNSTEFYGLLTEFNLFFKVQETGLNHVKYIIYKNNNVEMFEILLEKFSRN